MRYAKRTDDNHGEVREGIRKALRGCTVRDLSGAGEGIPDLMVGWRGRNYLFEIKDPAKPPSKRKLTPAQEQFHGEWQGNCYVVHSATEAVASILYAIVNE